MGGGKGEQEEEEEVREGRVRERALGKLTRMKCSNGN